METAARWLREYIWEIGNDYGLDEEDLSDILGALEWGSMLEFLGIANMVLGRRREAAV